MQNGCQTFLTTFLSFFSIFFFVRFLACVRAYACCVCVCACVLFCLRAFLVQTVNGFFRFRVVVRFNAWSVLALIVLSIQGATP